MKKFSYLAAFAKRFDAAQKAGERQTLEINGVEYAFRWCPPGKFLMGSPESEEKRMFWETRHKVGLTRGFWLLETQVTQAMWRSTMGSNPSCFKGDALPVEQVSWNDCQDFIRKLQSAAPSGWKFSLPTEAQWDYLPPLSCASSNCQYC